MGKSWPSLGAGLSVALELLRGVLVERLGAEAATATPTRLAYDLRKLRGKGLLRIAGLEPAA